MLPRPPPPPPSSLHFTTNQTGDTKYRKNTESWAVNRVRITLSSDLTARFIILNCKNTGFTPRQARFVVCANVRSKGQERKNAPLTNNENTHTQNKKHAKVRKWNPLWSYNQLKVEVEELRAAVSECMRRRAGLFHRLCFWTAPLSPPQHLHLHLHLHGARRQRNKHETRHTDDGQWVRHLTDWTPAD